MIYHQLSRRLRHDYNSKLYRMTFRVMRYFFVRHNSIEKTKTDRTCLYPSVLECEKYQKNRGKHKLFFE